MSEAILIWLYLGLGNLLPNLLLVSLVVAVPFFVILGASAAHSEMGQSTHSGDKSVIALYNKLIRLVKPVVVTLVLLLVAVSLYPSKDDLKWIIGGALVWNGASAASNIEGIEKLPKNTVDAMNHFLESIGKAEEVQ